MNDIWYDEVAAGDRLTQGDIVLNCPILQWNESRLQTSRRGEKEGLRNAVEALAADVVVMTQACDLEFDKVANVILCPHLSLDAYHHDVWEADVKSKGQNPTDKSWRRHCEDIRDGYLWNMAMLNAGKTATLDTPHRVVFFDEVYTIPRSFLESLLVARSLPRLCLLPPYREHLSQAFARFFMRVGLPVPVEESW